MDVQTFTALNGPLTVLNTMIIAFYIFCMIRPLHGEKIKQPLKLLLWTLIGCTITYLLSGVVAFFSEISAVSSKINQTFFLLMICSASNSMTSSVWLNFFYYSQIVPAHSALSIWIKNNVKSIIYGFWITERIYCLFDFTSMFLRFTDFDVSLISNNLTMVDDMPENHFYEEMFWIVFYTLKAHFVFCLCVMVMSSGSTVLYLCGHMRHMAANGQPASSPRFRNQVRVTVTGLLQGVLYVFSASWIIYSTFQKDGIIYIGFTMIDSTVINLYMSATLFNLGAGQAVFRQRAEHIWLRAAHCFKAPQVQQTDQGA
ncbi:uncharacterized protein LOC120834379 [Gasterosteus aculeatus]